MVYKIKFGTDGWRGFIAEDYTFDNVRRCAQGFANYLLEQGRQGQWVVVGHDKRFQSENFAAAAAGVLAANGLNVYLSSGGTPTPTSKTCLRARPGPVTPNAVNQSLVPVTLESIRAPIADDLRAVDEVIRRSIDSEVVLVRTIADYIIDAGGKRLRPALLLLAADAVGAVGGPRATSSRP